MSSRNREKRSRTPSVEANTSFVKNVTSRVSGLLPATLTRWFSTPSSSSANGSAPIADPTDSSTDDEVVEPPPSKRVRLSVTGNSFYAAQDVNAPTDTLEPITPYSPVQSPPSRTAFRRDTNFASTQTPPQPRETNFASTPLSALDPPEDRAQDTTIRFKHHTVSSVGHSVAGKRKSLFDSEMNSDASIRACAKTSCNTMRDPNQPFFNASLLASPFYPGRTMYGGASACYINQANIRQRKNAIVNKSNTTDNTISYSARRVMDLLEQYSSPLNDAKRISQYLASPSLGSSLNSSDKSNKLAPYKTRELHVPSIASILRLKQRGRLMDTTAAARQILASRSSTSDYRDFIPPSYKPADPVQPGSEAQSNLTSKVKSRLTRPTRRKSQDVEAEMPAPVSLPSAVLHIDRDNLPKFSFEAPPAPPVPSATSTPSSVYTLTETSTKVTETKKVTKIIETPIRKPDAVPTIHPYKFASPVRISSDLVNHDSTLPKFTFGSPERKIGAKSSDSNTDDSSVVGPKESAVKDKDWKCAECWVTNKAVADKCVCCGAAPQPASEAPKPKKCSVCKLADSQATGDKCGNCAKMTTNNISQLLVSKDEPSKWKCEVCLVPNEADAEKCVCCSAPNPKKPAESAPPSDAGSDWKCDVCWIQNKASVDKCAACGGAKPGAKAAKQNANTTFNFGIKPSSTDNIKPSKPDNVLNNIVKSQASKWECPNCLVRNEGDKTKCACCESDKPGSVKEPEKKFNFGVNTSFKFGIDPKLQETPKPVETKPAEEPKQNAVPAESKKEEPSETNNNVLPKTPMFSFGVPPKKAEDQADGAKKVEAKVDSAPQLNFSFGVPASAAAAAPAATAPETKAAEEKPQEVPTVTFTLPKPKEAPKTRLEPFSFGATTQPAKPAEKPEVPTVPVLAAKEVKDVPISSSAAPTPAEPAAAATSAAAAPTFTFGSLKPPANLFAPVATTSSAPLTFGAALPAPVTTAAPMPLFQAPATTSSAPLSVFQKPEPASTAPSLFQKTEPAVTTAAAPAPLFSFGSNAAPAAADKPKFNFTFGSNKTESTPIFGAPTDPSTNKFALPTGNALGSGTGLSSTSGGNGLTGNALGGTGLTGSTLGGSTLGTGTGLGTSSMPNALGGSGMSSPITGGVLGSNSLPSNPLGSSTPSSNLQTPVGGGIFGAAMPKENNIWNSNNSSNLFVSNTSANTNSLQKPAAFTFGGATSTPFNTSASTPAFGGAQTVPNVFGMGNQPSNQASVFSPPASGSVGGWGGAAATPAPVVFGAPQASVPTFDSPTPAPAFNFSAQQQPNRVFGFGQQPQQQQPTPGVYNFGGSPAAPQVQFNMGSAPNTAVRRVRKAVRKNTPR